MEKNRLEAFSDGVIAIIITDPQNPTGRANAAVWLAVFLSPTPPVCCW